MTQKRNVLVLVVDTQVDFVMEHGRLPVPGAEKIVLPGIRFLANLDPDEVAGVLFTHDTHDAKTYMGSRENLGDPAAGIRGFPLHCEVDTPGWQNVFNPLIVPDGIPIWSLRKGVFDMWEEPSHKVRIHPIPRMGEDGYSWGTERDFFFHGHADQNGRHDPTARGGEIGNVDTVRVIGVASDFCVAWAINGLLERGFRVEVVGDLTAGIEKDIERTVVDRFAGRVLVI